MDLIAGVHPAAEEGEDLPGGRAEIEPHRLRTDAGLAAPGGRHAVKMERRRESLRSGSERQNRPRLQRGEAGGDLAAQGVRIVIRAGPETGAVVGDFDVEKLVELGLAVGRGGAGEEDQAAQAALAGEGEFLFGDGTGVVFVTPFRQGSPAAVEETDIGVARRDLAPQSLAHRSGLRHLLLGQHGFEAHEARRPGRGVAEIEHSTEDRRDEHPAELHAVVPLSDAVSEKARL